MSRARDVASNNLALISPTSDGNLLTASSGAWVSQAPAPAPPSGNQVEMVASGTIANGDTVILNSDGTVSAITGAAGGEFSKQTFQNSNIVMKTSGTLHTGENKVVIVYQDQTSSTHGKIVAATISGDTLTFGTPLTYNSTYTNEADVAYDVNANLIVVAYETTPNQWGEIQTFTLSGTTFTQAGSATRWNSSNSSGATAIQYDPDAQGCLLFWRNISSSNYGQCKYVGVSGSTIAFGNPSTYNSALTTKNRVIYNTQDQHHLVCFKNGGNSSYVDYAVVTMTSAGVVAFRNSGNTISTGFENHDIVYNPDQNIVALSGQFAGNGSYSGNVVIMTPAASYSYTNTGIPNAASTKFTSSGETADWTRLIYNPDNQKFAVFWIGNNSSTIINYVRGSQFTVDTANNNLITLEAPTSFVSVNNQYYIAPVYDTNADRIFLAYHDQSDGNYGKAGIMKFPSTTLTASNFLGFANGAYTNGQTATIQTTGNIDDAQSGLVINTTYFVQNDGSLGTSPSPQANVTAGKAIAATKILIA